MAKSDVDHTLAVARVYDLLSQLWIRELDSERLATIRTPSIKDALRDLGLMPPEESLEELATEYCRLLIGPRDQSPPIQSVWQQSQLGTASVASVKKFAELVEYEIPAGLIEDHLGVELAVMSRLVTLTAEDSAGQTADGVADGMSESEEAAALFFQRHLHWPAPFFLAINQRAELDFYRSLADVTQQFLRVEREVWVQRFPGPDASSGARQ